MPCAPRDWDVIGGRVSRDPDVPFDLDPSLSDTPLTVELEGDLTTQRLDRRAGCRVSGALAGVVTNPHLVWIEQPT